MLRGEQPAACSICYRNEKLGMTSYRLRAEFWYGDQGAALAESTAPDGTTEAPYQFLDLRLGNQCNLRCRMCTPRSSRALIPEYAEINGLPQDDEGLSALNGTDWCESPEAWNDLFALLPTVDRVHFAGGEPFLSQAGAQFLERVVESGLSRRITLSYNTNLTLLPARLRSLWPLFKQVVITVSLDGYGALNEYIRFPSRWGALDRNLKILDAEHRALNLSAVNVHVTIQAYNIFGLADLHHYLKDGFGFIDPYFETSFVEGNDALDARILTPGLKARARQQIQKFSEDLLPAAYEDPRALAFVARLSAILKYLDSADLSAQIPEFRRITKIYDGRRNQSLTGAAPELAPLMQD